METSRLLEQFSILVDAINERLGRLVAWLSLIMVLLVVTIVALRYLFQYGSIALQESVMYVNALIFTVGAAYTLKERGHVRVDIFYNRLSERRQAVVDLFGGLLFLLPFAVFIIVASWDYIAISWRIREGSAESSGLPLVFLLKTSIHVLGFLLLLQGLSEIAKAVKRLGHDR